MSELSLVMKGLNCANCAGKIEKNVNKIQGVTEASINLMNQEMFIAYSNIDKEKLVRDVTEITVALEPHVLVSEKVKYGLKTESGNTVIKLEGLNCANCAGKIEKNVNKLKGVTEASINLMNQEMLLSYEGVLKDTIVKEVEKITVALEPHVKVYEKINKKVITESGNTVIKLEGLNCANCAGKIEKNVNKLKSVTEASINLMNQEMLLSYEGVLKDTIVKEVEKITVALEPHVKVYEKAQAHTHSHNHGDSCDCHDHAHGEECACSDQDHGEIAVPVKKSFLDVVFNPELKSRLIRYGFGLALYLIAIIGILGSQGSMIFFIGAYILFGGDVIIKAVKNISRGELFDENFLMGVATIGAFAIGDFAEAVAVMLFYQVGEFFQDMAVDKSRKSIKSLMSLKADYANVIRNGNTEKVDPGAVYIDEIILVKPGEKVPLDGIVIEGESQIDASSLIGESVPRTIRTEDMVMSGVVNLTGAVKIKVTKDYENSTVAKIMDMVENASNKKAPTERFITRFSRIYTPIVVLLAALLAIVPPLIIQDALFSDWLYRGLVFLVVSCPCALVISVPLSFFSGIGYASKKGILVKGSVHLQTLNDINTVVFDKTGTLTKGVFTVTKVNPVENISEQELMKYAAAVENLSNHPIAKSVIKDYEAKYTESLPEAVDYEEISGKGVKGVVEGKTILAGNAKLMEDAGIEFSGYTGAGSVVHTAVDGKYLGYIVISDIIKEDSKETIRKLKSKGITTVMLTGDRKETADIIAAELGLDEVYSELLPDEKVYAFEKIYEKNPQAKAAYAGDGINDAPVLARADVGIAMGGVGSDAAIEAADVVIMTDEPSKIPEAMATASKTMAIARQNIVFALSIKILVLALSAVGFASMWLAVFADVGVAVIAILNSMRVK